MCDVQNDRHNGKELAGWRELHAEVHLLPHSETIKLALLLVHSVAIWYTLLPVEHYPRELQKVRNKLTAKGAPQHEQDG